MKITASLLIATVLCLSGAQLHAGTQLKLNTGVIDTSEPSRLLSAELLNQTEWLVQFKTPVTENLKSRLQKANVVIHSYIPEDALLVRMPFATALEVNQWAQLQSLLPFRAEMKLSPELGAVSAVTSQARETLIVSLFNQTERLNIETRLRDVVPDALIQRSAAREIIVTTERRNLLSIASLEGVEHIQRLIDIETFHKAFEADSLEAGSGNYTDLTGFETGTRVMNFASAWEQGLSGQNQVVGMADTGLDSGNAQSIHRDFAGAIKSGYAVGMFGRSWADPMGHGTHVAGSVLGRGTASGGLLKGGAYSAQMVAQGMWSPVLNNLSVPSNLAGMFNQAYSDGARVHTNSWGAAANFGSYEKMAATVDEIMFAKNDLLILFAAGNSGVDKNRDGRIDGGSMATPGTAKNALTVGASENLVSVGGIQRKIGELKPAPENWPVAPISDSKLSDNINGLAMFSSRGPTRDGRIKPDVVAPGTNILSVKSQEATAEVLWGAYNTDYVFSGGTSMSTPLVAAAAALTRQFLIEKMSMAQPSAALVKAMLLHTATDLFPGQYGELGAARGQEILTPRPNSDEGYGRVNVAQVIAAPQSSSFFVSDSAGVNTGGVSEAKMNLAVGGKFMVNLVWTDAPGSVNSAKALVNDLDLEVVLPNGQVLAVNDSVNNHAYLQASTEAGELTIRVRGVNVPMGKSGLQPFALVASVQPE